MSDDASVAELVGEAANVLVLASGMGGDRDVLSRRLLDRATPGPVNAIAVTYNRPPDDWLAEFADLFDGAPANARVVDASGAGSEDDVVEVTAPDDLTGLEIAISEAIDEFHREPGRTVFCFDSVTALLQYVDLERAYRFLHALVERLWHADVLAVFHMDPAAHEEGTVATVATLFDALVSADPSILEHTDAVVEVDDVEAAVRRRPRFEREGKA